MSIDDIQSVWNGFSYNIKEYICLLPKGLEGDYVGLYGVIDVGKRAFLLRDNDLELFTRRALAAVLDHGAVPVEGLTPHRELRYGTERDELIDNVVKYWLYESDRDPEMEDVCFGVPGVTFD